MMHDAVTSIASAGGDCGAFIEWLRTEAASVVEIWLVGHGGCRPPCFHQLASIFLQKHSKGISAMRVLEVKRKQLSGKLANFLKLKKRKKDKKSEKSQKGKNDTKRFDKLFSEHLGEELFSDECSDEVFWEELGEDHLGAVDKLFEDDVVVVTREAPSVRRLRSLIPNILTMGGCLRSNVVKFLGNCQTS